MVITQEQHEKRKKEEKYEIAGEKCQEQTQEVNQELYGIVKSDTHYGAYYLITGKDKLNCSCPGKNCKHIREIQNGQRTCIRISRSSKE